MAKFNAMLVEETTTTTGTGDLTLGGATTGHRPFQVGFGAPAQCLYTILWGPYWEYGIGTITDHGAELDTLSRDLCLGSSIGGAKLGLGPGTKYVYCEHVPEGFNSLGSKFFVDGDTSPSIKGANVFICANTGATTITDFDDDTEGQMIHILFTNGNTTLQQGATLKHPAAANITPTANDVVTYIRASGTAFQLVSWSQNG